MCQKVTLFCEKLPLCEAMHRLSRPFVYACAIRISKLADCERTHLSLECSQ